MFLQVVRARVADVNVLRASIESWDRDIKPGAAGFLGSTEGVTAERMFFGITRWRSEADARGTAARPGQRAWARDLVRAFAGAVDSDESSDVDIFLRGGSDNAGLVRVRVGRVSDVPRARRALDQIEARYPRERPFVIGGTLAWLDGGRFIETMYFTSEPDTRAATRATISPELQAIEDEFGSLFVAEPEVFDLRDVWFLSP